MNAQDTRQPTAEAIRLEASAARTANWKRWGPYLSERQWGTVREHGSADGSMFLRKNLLTSLTGALLGLPVGWCLTWLTAASYNNDLIRLPVVSAPWIWWTTLLLAVAFALAAHAVVQWTLSRMDYLEALKVKE